MQIKKQQLEKIRKYAKSLCSKADLTHDWSHICFVVNHSKYIAKKEGMDINVVEVGALLHDIGYDKNDMVNKDHGYAASKIAQKYLRSLKFEEKFIDAVVDTIRYHNGNKIANAKTKEALAVHDADKLDIVGPRGLIRAICWNTKFEFPDDNIDELYVAAINCAKKRIKRVKTKTGKILVKEYFNMMKEFRKGYDLMNKKCK